MKPLTVDILSEILTQSMTWRLREISDLRHTIGKIPSSLSSSLNRAAIPILYAHWEGHVKICASTYVGFVALRRLPFRELHHGFMLGTLRAELDRFGRERTSKSMQIEFLKRLEELQLDQFRGKPDKIVETRSNLSYEVLCEISEAIGVSYNLFEADATFINKGLVERRNNIAHGESVTLDINELSSTMERTVGLMRTFQNIVENAALEKMYLKPQPS